MPEPSAPGAPRNRGDSSEAKTPSAPIPSPVRAGRVPAVSLAAALVVAVLCGTLAWLTPRPQSDLFLALAGGRDVARGHLGQPDTWSFANGGRVWIHQNWLGDLVIYAAERAGGEAGLLALKAVLLAAIIVAVAGAARQRGVSLPVGLLAGGAALAAWPQALLLRANLFSLIFSPLLLLILYRSRRRPATAWFATALIALWANTHGSYLFGIAVMGLWTAVRVGHAVFRPAPAPGWRGALHSAAATLAAILAAALLNPFGLHNLETPFLVQASPVWKSLTEWQPLFSSEATFAHIPWLFLGLAGVVVLGAGARLAFGRRKGRPAGSGPEANSEAGPVLIFETVLAVVLVVMALRSQRFVLFAAVLLAPLAAIVLEWLLRPGRRRIPILAASALVLAGAWAQSSWVLPHYASDNPARASESLFGRMVYLKSHFPEGAAAFLDDNGIGGRVYNEWRWEGYLHWRCPQLELFAGGRAHQAYSDSTAREYFGILEGPDPAARLSALDVHLAVVPLDADLGPFVLALLQSKSSPWVYLYCDRMSAVFVDLRGPGHDELVKRAYAGDLEFPDEATAALSRGMFLTSPSVRVSPREAMDALNRALLLRPTRFAYAPLFSRARAAGLSQEELIRLFEDHARRLQETSADGPGGAEVLVCRVTVAGILDTLYDPEQQAEQKRQVRALSAEANRRLEEIVGRYRFTTRIR